MNAVDTNVLVYSLDAVDPVKHGKAKALLVGLAAGSTPTILPWQVAAELLNWLRRSQAAGKLSAADVDAHFRATLAPFPLAIPSAKAFPKYFDLFSRFSLSHWDAMLLAACHEAGVTTLYSEDMDAGTDFDGLRVVNPFA
jgi:predicted nucleic acid-binding protein